VKPLHHYAQNLLSTRLGTKDLCVLDQWAQDILIENDPRTEDIPLDSVWTADVDVDFGTPGDRLAVLRALAPAELLSLAWLSRITQPKTGHFASNLKLAKIYDLEIMAEPEASNPRERFRSLLIQEGLSLPEAKDPGFFNGHSSDDARLTHALLHLYLAHRAQRLFPELIGYTIAHFGRINSAWDEAMQRSERSRSKSHLICVEAAKTHLQEHDHSWRIHRGWKLYQMSYRLQFAHLNDQANAIPHRVLMSRLIQTKWPEAKGYHHKVMLQGDSLDSLIATHQEDLTPVLNRLRQSHFVDAACPVKSQLIQATHFGGPMFGVFQTKELALMEAWISDPNGSTLDDPCSSALTSTASSFPETSTESKRTPYRSYTYRSLYLNALSTESPLEASPEQKSLCLKILNQAKWWNRLRPFAALPKSYDAHVLTLWIEHRHHQSVEKAEASKTTPPIDKSFCRWLILQCAPAILTDGAWLSGIQTLEERIDTPTLKLWRTYLDELGDGHTEWNHPNVYRRLLDSQRIPMAAFDQPAFIEDPRLIDSAFRLPAYLMSVALFSRDFLPEILGLNLAIETSGLGHHYLSAIRALKAHDIDPSIIELHLSIDNLSSGHSRWALEAIIHYLNELDQRGGYALITNSWSRIRQGYASLSTAALPMATHSIAYYALSQHLPWLCTSPNTVIES